MDEERIAKLLRKRKPTGRDVGILSIERVALAYRATLAGEEDPELIQAERVDKMLAKLPLDNNYRDYLGYCDIWQWGTLYMNVTRAAAEGAMKAGATIESQLKLATIAEEVERLYPDPEVAIRLYCDKYSLSEFAKDTELGEEWRKDMSTARAEMLAGIWIANAYRLMLELTAEHYDIPDAVVLSIDAEPIRKKAQEINELSSALGEIVRAARYTTEEERERKLRTLHRNFPPLDLSLAEIPDSLKEEAAQYIPNYYAYSGEGLNKVDLLLFVTSFRGEV